MSSGDKTALCTSITNNGDIPCHESSTPGTCETRTCDHKTGATSQSDCDAWRDGCRWIGGTSTCVGTKSDCTYVLTSSLSTGDKTALCNSIKNASGILCTESSTSGTCENRTCA